MTSVRKIISGTFYVIGTWVIASFIGVMFNTANAGLWTTSLMWSLLASLVILPGLVFVYHAGESRRRENEVAPSEQAEERPFVEESREETLWPPSEEESSVQ
jgi:membrane protein implicated in regulation of membrane protease activity